MRKIIKRIAGASALITARLLQKPLHKLHALAIEEKNRREMKQIWKKHWKD